MTLWALAVVAILGDGAASRVAPASAPVDALLARSVAGAEASLREGELQIAESRYRDALFQGWLLIGALEAAEGRLPGARDAFQRAAGSAVEVREALQSLALVHMQMREPAQAVALLTQLAGRNPKDGATRRMLAQALVANGQPGQAVQELEEALAAAPDDLELVFTLASGYLRQKNVGAAERLFARLVRERPIPQTRVLVGRTYRDFGEHDRARAELLQALKQDPRTRRAHYYLGMVAVSAEGTARLDEAIEEFRQELKLAPGDPVASLRLGMALVEAQRQAEALPVLERATRSGEPRADALLYLGRCQLGLQRPAEAADALRRALDLSSGPALDDVQRGSIHYQLGLALRQLGATQDAAVHFAEAERYSAQRAQSTRERLARYLADAPDPESTAAGLAPLLEASPLTGLAPGQRAELRRRATAALARAYLNLGVMQAQAGRFARAAELFEGAAAVEPDFPQVQYSLGVAHFNAQQFAQATGPLSRALEQAPGDPNVKRTLAMAWLNSDSYERAVELLRDDPQRAANPSLEYAYGLALVRSGRADQAESTFARLLAAHGDSAELNVLLGQAHAQQGDYESAVRALQHALALEPGVPEANAALGVIYLKQGRLAEAEQALRAELKGRPDDLKSQHNLATVLDLRGQPDEALAWLRAALESKPDFADARYLLGKVLLAQGAATEAAEQLEAAARLAPDDANIRYQLGQAYARLGRTDDAQGQFDVFRQLKDKRRGGTP